MSEIPTATLNNLVNFGKYMYLKIFIDSNDETLKNKYIEYINQRDKKMIADSEHIDAGFDIFAPEEVILSNKIVNRIDYKISCSAEIHEFSSIDPSENTIGIERIYKTGFYMYPRSSISKTHLRLANNVGIIDAGYRGHLMGMFDVLYHDHDSLTVNKFDRHLQICAPGLIPIMVELVETKEELGSITIRGDEGVGSTGK